jgi:hypothetical protein
MWVGVPWRLAVTLDLVGEQELSDLEFLSIQTAIL